MLTGKNHASHLPLLLKTWLPVAGSSVHIFTDSKPSKDLEDEISSIGAHIVNTGCRSDHSVEGLSCKMQEELTAFLRSSSKETRCWTETLAEEGSSVQMFRQNWLLQLEHLFNTNRRPGSATWTTTTICTPATFSRCSPSIPPQVANSSTWARSRGPSGKSLMEGWVTKYQNELEVDKMWIGTIGWSHSNLRNEMFQQ